jgi:hypothetical protein
VQALRMKQVIAGAEGRKQASTSGGRLAAEIGSNECAVSMELVSEGVEIRSRCGVWAERRAWGNNRAATVSERA